MKVIKIILGCLTGLYSLAQLGNLLYIFINKQGSYLPQVSAVFGLALFSFVISFAFFKSAFTIKDPTADSANTEGN